MDRRLRPQRSRRRIHAGQRLAAHHVPGDHPQLGPESLQLPEFQVRRIDHKLTGDGNQPLPDVLLQLIGLTLGRQADRPGAEARGQPSPGQADQSSISRTSGTKCTPV